MKNVAWVEGEVESKNIVFSLADAIVNAAIPETVNRWREKFRMPEQVYVTYNETFVNNTQGVYRHTDGNNYNVRRINDETTITGGRPTFVDSNGFINEILSNSPFTTTGKRINIRTVIVGGVSYTVPGLLVVMLPNPDYTASDPVYKRNQCWLVAQERQELDGTWQVDPQWNSFKLIGLMPDGWDYFMDGSRAIGTALTHQGHLFAVTATLSNLYIFTSRRYTAIVNTTDAVVVLECTPNNPEGVAPRTFDVQFTKRLGQDNYLTVIYGEGYEGTLATGDPAVTYTGIIDPATVFHGVTPVIIDQVKANDMFIKMNSEVPIYKPMSEKWALDFDRVTEIKSPPAYFFYGANTVITGAPIRRRRPDFIVRYYLSVTNNRAAIVIEGDPAPDIDAYYRSFGYIGAITPFSDRDYSGNFGVTVGMGDLVSNRTGFILADIRESETGKYAGFGRYTSNGMQSVSMLHTRGKVLFQAHYPSFLTQLPNYPNVGVIPAGLSRLVLDEDGFQASLWTKHYHASPVYLAHQSEGYRGYLDGCVAISDHNLVNLDELLVDTEVVKPGGGTWIEVYKFFSIARSPVNLFRMSANPFNMAIAILKEIR